MKQYERITILLLALIFVIWFIFKKNSYNRYKQEIFKSYDISIGHILNYSISGDANNRIMEYDYQNNEGASFKRKITPSIFYDECENIEICKQKKFLVIYSKIDNRNSLIDLSQEVNSIDSLYVSKNLKKFE